MLGEHYGNAFVSQYGEQPNVAWVGALQDLSTADLGVGIAALKSRNNPFPPNPGEFHAMCRPELPQQRRCREGTGQPRIARIPLPPEEAKKQIQKLKEIINGE